MNKLLAVDPGLKTLGYSIFDIENKNLIAYGAFDVPKIGHIHKKLRVVHNFIISLFDIYDILEIITEGLFISHRNAWILMSVIREIKDIAQDRKLNYRTINVQSARKFFGIKKDSSEIKQKVFEWVVSKYGLQMDKKSFDICDAILAGAYALEVRNA